MYNGLVKLRNKVENAWAQIDVQLKRRYDLIPNLVETVKGYAAHEKRDPRGGHRRPATRPCRPPAPAQEQAQAENVLTGALKSLFALSEAYPDLKANQNFLNLQEELTSTEDRIAYARQFYNDTVNRYNTKIQTFPIVDPRRRCSASRSASTSRPRARPHGPGPTVPVLTPVATAPPTRCTTRSRRTSAAPSS